MFNEIAISSKFKIEMPEAKNIVIISAGAVGLFCRNSLAKDSAKLTILERNYPGSGQSMRTGAGYTLFAKVPRKHPMVVYS